jgi:predicted nuclease of predicted toxin-antitoxin system
VRVLLDEQVPIGLASLLAGHDARTVVGMGWSGIKNGELLKRAASVFDAFVTMDRNLQNQQNLASLPFGVLLIRAPSNRLRDLLPMVPMILAALPKLRPGELTVVGG